MDEEDSSFDAMEVRSDGQQNAQLPVVLNTEAATSWEAEKAGIFHEPRKIPSELQ